MAVLTCQLPLGGELGSAISSTSRANAKTQNLMLMEMVGNPWPDVGAEGVRTPALLIALYSSGVQAQL